MKQINSNKFTHYVTYSLLGALFLCILLTCIVKIAYANSEDDFYSKCIEANASQGLNNQQIFNTGRLNNVNEFSYEQYILDNADNKYCSANKFESKNVIVLKQTLADAKLIPDNASLYDLHYGDYYDAEIAMYDEYCVLYNIDDASQYYVGFANVSDGKVQDYIFAKNNYFGQVLNDCVYDWDTGLIYIPKDHMQGKGKQNKESVLEIQLQLLIRAEVNSENQVADTVNLSINKNGNNTDCVNIKLNALDTSIVIPVGEINPSNTKIIANNNIEISNKCYFDNGNLYISESPSNVSCIKVEIRDEDASESNNIIEHKNQLSTSIDDIPCLPYSLNKSLPATSGGNFDYVGAKYVVRMPLYYSETPSAAPYQECLYGVNGFITDESIKTFADRIWNDSGEVDLSNLLMIENRSLNLFTLYPVDVFRESGIVLALKCGHIGTPASHDPDLKEIRTKILAINSNAGYALVGFVTQVAGYTNQGGCGIYKVKYDLKAGCQMTKRTSLGWSYSNPNYSLSGVRYNIYYDAQCSSFTGVSIIINEDGSGHTSENALIAYKEYFVKEDISYTGNNYFYNSSIGYVYLSSVNTYTNTITWNGSAYTTDPPLSEAEPLGLWKADSQLKDPGIAAGSVTSFEGAWYEYQFYTDYFTKKNEIDIHRSSYQRHWVLQTDINGQVCLSEKYRNSKISGDEFYEDENNIIVSPLGTYVIHETKAPVGYLISDKFYIMQITGSKEGGLHAVCTCFDGDSGEEISSIHDSQSGNDFVVALENIIRGDYSFIKTNDESEQLSGIPFKITSVSTGEWHIVVTDSNGVIDTSSKHVLHTTNTNYNDTLYDASTGKIINENALRSDCGCWFSINKKTHQIAGAVDDVGALPYDSYTIEEILISKNEMYFPFAKRSFIVNTNFYKINGGTWINSKVSCVTEANGAGGGRQINPSSYEHVYDRIYYSNLINGNIYEVNAWLVERSSCQIVPMINTESTVFYLTKSFIANESIGYVDVDAYIDTRPYIGQNLVWFVELFDAGYTRQIAEHNDLFDEQETLTVNKPSFETDLFDKKTFEKTIDKSTDIVLIDQIAYRNLNAGTKYSFVGNLYDKQKGQVVKNVLTGEPISASCEFIAESEYGNAALYYTFDSSTFPDCSELVSCVELYDGDLCVCANNSLEDKRETVIVGQPQIKTNASTIEGAKSFVKGPNSKIKDTINYENFTENAELTLYSWFCYADTGVPVTDGYIDDDKAIEIMSDFIRMFGGNLTKANVFKGGSQDFTQQWLVEFFNAPNKYDDSSLSEYDWNELAHFLFSKKNFIPKEKDGKEEIHFLFDSSNCREGNIVAYTIVTMGDTLLLADTNINNEDETLLIEQRIEPSPIPGIIAKTYDNLIPLIAILVLLFISLLVLNHKLHFNTRMFLPAYLALKSRGNYNCVNKELLKSFNMYFGDL